MTLSTPLMTRGMRCGCILTTTRRRPRKKSNILPRLQVRTLGIWLHTQMDSGSMSCMKRRTRLPCTREMTGPDC
ncbi:hypothetical protein M3J09_001397 [Ascochyta lentis]